MENKAKKNDKFDPADLKPEDMMKFEIATELGLADKVINGRLKRAAGSAVLLQSGKEK